MIQLIASDMDGTLLGQKMEVSAENVAAIRYATEQGVKFVIATGRNYAEAITPLTEAGIECPIISANGAQAFDETGNELFTIEIAKETAKDIMKALNHDRVYYEICTQNSVYTNNMAKRVENMAIHVAHQIPHLTFKMALAMASAQLHELPVTPIDSFDELIDNPEHKILKFIAFSHDEAKVLSPIREAIEALDDVVVTSSYPNNIEINHQNAQKGIAVKQLADQLNIPLEQVMTIGDNFNDLSMLAIAGVSFAMGNAEQDVKETAKYITDLNTESGVGKAIRRAIDENL
ncbi:Cof-type HAD-IIB family hydrolase [Vagococcus xieshaowenii]|uniref:HAD family phosphatase n=1 Tax=Vagococcus xieshaowenii TaxID=2562451 RepID=A0AAJ5JQ59_9ENTE|nr:Cof-type HAD-IIB family hydrolase [Vagococcus xieshaowenii]QCA29380.1 HAD family phosphatase [Vagococcus xieshaowenii]TFZ39329.1 HAD family phosphatase [Vagococcus xieshaowenii]